MLLSAGAVTQEFHLSITSLGSDRYLIRTEDTAMGVPIAEAQVEWPVESWLQLAQPAMDDPILGLLRGQSEVEGGNSDLHQLGALLYKALFQDEEAIRESWLRAQGIAQNRHELLRFRLGLKESRLQRLPWEVLHHNGHPLTTRSDLTFTRYAANLLVGQTFKTDYLPEVDTPLRVLMVIAGPRDQKYLQLLQEKLHLQELLTTENGAILPIDIQILEQPDRNALAQALEQGNYQVLHYAGHSDFGESGGDLLLVNRRSGLTERLSGDDLAGLLVNNHVALTVFNSCRSGHTAGDDVEMDWRQQNLVQALVSRGVPSVIAMAERIPDEVAIAFTRLFYKNLRKGYPIDLSLSRTRQGLISAFSSERHYWALPILYLQPDFEGYLVRDERSKGELFDSAGAALLSPASAPVAVPDPALASPAPLPEDDAAGIGTPLEVLPAADLAPDEETANLVKQLSGTDGADAVREPGLSADPAEVLTEVETEREKMDIYSALPDVPLPAEPETTTPDTATAATPRATLSQAPVASGIPSSDPPLTFAERLPWLWLALGLIGLTGILGLTFLLLRPATNTPPAAQTLQCLPPGDGSGPDVDTLLRQAERALQQERYTDARQDFECALTQELVGAVEPNAASDAIWPLVSNTRNSELLYIQGRIRWQEIGRSGEDAASYEQGLEQRTLAAQALDAWERTDDTFLQGRIAQGFAYYATGNLNAAIASWEAALTLHDAQRQAQIDPVNTAVVDSVILHAYAGLVMARTRAAQLNLDALTDDERIAEANESDQSILQGEADSELADAREYYQRLQDLTTATEMSPAQLQAVTGSPTTWNNWLWTESLLTDWREVYRQMETPSNDSES